MVKTLVRALALAALPSALAFRNTSPFFLFSTANLEIPDDASVAEASQVTTNLFEALKGCPTRSYLVVEQQGVSSADFLDGRSAPRLSHYMASSDSDAKTKFAIPDVVGTFDLEKIVDQLRSDCGHTTEWISHSAPGSDKALRMSKLQRADETMESLISKESNREDFTVIYITTPIDESVADAQLQEDTPPYEMENAFGNFDQLELKRDLSSHVKRANSTSSAGLFERYQYFTPGLFMAFAAIIPLFLILLVGIRALTSLEVSYYAFSKEMGPNAQKK